MMDLIRNFSPGEIHGRAGNWLPPGRRPVISVSDEQYRILHIVENAIAHTQQIIPLPANQELLVRATGLYDANIVDTLRDEVADKDAKVTDYYSGGSADPLIREQARRRGAAEIAACYGVGNCGEHAVVAAYVVQQSLFDAGIEVPVMMMSRNDREHHYVQIGDWRVIPENKVIVCDAWPVAATPHFLSSAINRGGTLAPIYSLSSATPPMRIDIPDIHESRFDTVTAARIKYAKPAVLNRVVTKHLVSGHLCNRISYVDDISVVIRNRDYGGSTSFSKVWRQRGLWLREGLKSQRAAAAKALADAVTA